MPMPSSKDFPIELTQQFNPVIQNLKGYAAPPQGKVRAKLNQNENPYEVSDEIKGQIINGMQSLLYGRYPQYVPVLRDKLAAKYNRSNEEILPGNGSNQLSYALFAALTGAGDRVVSAPPTFSLFDLVEKIHSVDSVHVDLLDDFTLNADTFIEASKDAKLTLMVSPNNPTGNEIEIAILKSVCETSKGFVFWDEAYGEFSDTTAIPLLDQYPNLIISRTFSKAFSLAGLRAGYLLAHPEIIDAVQKVSVPYNLNIMSEYIAATMLDHSDWMEEKVQIIIQERQRLYSELMKMEKINVFPSKANFLLCKMDNKKTVYQGLMEKRVLVRNMSGHHLLEDTFRVTVGTPEENDIFLEALKAVL